MSDTGDLDRSIDTLFSARPADLATALRDFLALARDRYRREKPWLAGLPPAIRAKLAAQHDEILEIGAALVQSLDDALSADVPYLVRRLCALARHNLIEKERDVIPYYDQEV